MCVVFLVKQEEHLTSTGDVHEKEEEELTPKDEMDDEEIEELDQIDEVDEEVEERISSRKSFISDPDKTDIDDEDDFSVSPRESPIPVDKPQVKKEETSPLRTRRPSRSCRPNSLIFNSDTTTLSPIKRRRKTEDSQASSGKTIITSKASSPMRRAMRNVNSVYRTVSPLDQVDHKPNALKRRIIVKNSFKKVTPMITSSSKRSHARESVKRAVSALTTVRLTPNGKKRGRPRKYPLPETAFAQQTFTTALPLVTSSPKKAVATVVPNSTGKKTSTPVYSRKMNPILAAIISGQELGTTKTGKPKGRPRVLPSLNEVLTLNGQTPSNIKAVPSPILGSRSSSRGAAAVSSTGCDCDAKYRTILSNLEEQLDKKFVESTQKLRKDMQERDDDNIRLHSKIIALQREVDILQVKLLKTEEAVSQRKELEELKAKYQQEISITKKSQWVSHVVSHGLLLT